MKLQRLSSNQELPHDKTKKDLCDGFIYSKNPLHSSFVTYNWSAVGFYFNGVTISLRKRIFFFSLLGMNYLFPPGTRIIEAPDLIQVTDLLNAEEHLN